MKKILISFLLVGISSVSYSQQRELWIEVDGSPDGKATVFLDVNSFMYETRETPEASLLGSRYKITNEFNAITSTGSTFTNVFACVENQGNLVIVPAAPASGKQEELRKYYWTKGGSKISDSMGEALCNMYIVSQKSRM